jgi:hypothetical protein
MRLLRSERLPQPVFKLAATINDQQFKHCISISQSQGVDVPDNGHDGTAGKPAGLRCPREGSRLFETSPCWMKKPVGLCVAR